MTKVETLTCIVKKMINRAFLFKSTIVLFSEQNQSVCSQKKKCPDIFSGCSGWPVLARWDGWTASPDWLWWWLLFCCYSSGLRRVMREGDGRTLYSGAVTMVTNRKECWGNYPDRCSRTVRITLFFLLFIKCVEMWQQRVKWRFIWSYLIALKMHYNAHSVSFLLTSYIKCFWTWLLLTRFVKYNKWWTQCSRPLWVNGDIPLQNFALQRITAVQLNLF